MLKLFTLILLLLAITTSFVFSSFISIPDIAATASPITHSTVTPIRHIVILFQENVAFDHYFGTYPSATNPPGEPKFIVNSHTPSVNGLRGSLLYNNTNAANPFRLDRTQAVTCDNNHGYINEQKAYNGGLLDKFVQFTGSAYRECNPKQVMGYYDGNTVTALWNYAQHYAMNDNFYGTTFGPSTLGHINLISGQTYGAIPTNVKLYGTTFGPSNVKLPSAYRYDAVINGTLIANVDPKFDDCSDNTTILMKGKNIGDLLNAKRITWGWFADGFRLPNKSTDVKINCNNRVNNTSASGIQTKDYYPDIEPFQYYNSTANPHHIPPSSLALIGYSDQANHQYDLADFWKAADSGNLPAISFIKAATYQDGHPEISDPLEEQTFLVNTINHLERLPDWNSTAVIITWDDSDGWYDHVMPPIINQSNDPVNDALLGVGLCGHAPLGAYQDRCGHGPRIPVLIISPYAKTNFVDHSLTDQSSIIHFIEDNWRLGRIGNQSFDSIAGSLMNMFDFNQNIQKAQKLFLDPSTGVPQK